MGGGQSKKASRTPAASRQKPPPPVNPFALPPNDSWEVERVPDHEWQSSPYAHLCPPKHPVTPPRAHGPPPLFVPFDTPNGGAGVGSLRQGHLEEATGGAELSEVPPTALCVEVLEVGGLNDTATPGNEDTAVVYCVAIIGTVTRVLDSQQSEGLDKVKFYGSRANFPLHDRGEIELIGLPLQVSVFLSSVSPAEPDREVGECCVELEKKWLFGTEGHTAWLRLVSSCGGGSAGRVKSLLLSRNESRMHHSLPDLSAVRARSQSPLTASSDEDTMLTDRSHMLLAGGVDISSASSRKALISNNGLLVLLQEVQSFNNHTQRMEWMRLVRAQHSFTCAQVLLILNTLRYQHEVVQGCKVFAKSVTDPMNLQTLIQAVQAPHDRTEVAEFLIKIQSKKLDKLRRHVQREL